MNRLLGEKVKYALIAFAFVTFAVFVVMPILPQVQSSFDMVSLSAAIGLAEGDGGDGGTGDAGSDSGTGTSGDGCCGDAPGDTPGDTPGGDVPPPPPPPAPVCTLNINPSSLPHPGGNTTLTWTTENAGTVSIDQNVGSVSLNGSKNVSVANSKTFTLTATGPGGTVACDDSVTVLPPPEKPVCTLTADPYSFAYPGGDTTLSWTTNNAHTVSIDQGVGSVSTNGSKVVTVGNTKTFTLTAIGDGGTVTCEKRVTVAPPSQPKCTLKAEPNTFPHGGGTTKLTWTTENADTASLNQNIGSVAKNGSQDVVVQSSKTFTLTATGPGGTVTCDAPVTVAPGQCELEIGKWGPATATIGGYVTYELEFKNKGTANCTGGGVHIVDELPSKVQYISESHSSNVTAGYQGTPVYDAGSHKVHFNADVLTPGESGWVTIKVKVKSQSSCGNFSIENKAKISAYELNNFGTWIESNKVVTSIENPCYQEPFCTLSANPYELPYGGGNTELTWTTSNATNVTIDQGVGTVGLNGSKSVFVDASKTFTLTASGPGGSITCGAPIVVKPPKVPKCTLSAAPNNFPYGGGNTTLTWTTDDATAVTIDQGVGAVTLDGSKSVAVQASKTFTLTATGPGGDVTCQTAVSVGSVPPPTCTINADPGSLPYGGGYTALTWTTTNADSVSIDQNIGSVAPNGSKSVAVHASKTFTLTATNESGSVACEIPVTVGLQDFPSCTLVANPSNFPYGGGNTALSWTTTNADTVSLNHNLGVVAPNGSKSTLVTETKTFTLTATNSRGTVTCDAPVTVGAPEQPTCSLAITPESIVKGENARVDWNSSNVNHVVIKKIVNGVESLFKDTNAGQGSVIITPETSATYKGTFTGPGGTITCEDTVTVVPASLSCTISASPSSHPYGGGNTVLTWTSNGADTASIDQGIGAVEKNGSKSTLVTQSKTFTLTVANEGGSYTCNAPVTVGAPDAPSCTLTANPNHLPYGGGNSILTWTTENADTVSINNGVGTVAKNGSKNISTTDAKTYTLTAQGPGGTVTCDTPITIAAPDAPSCTLTATPGSHPYGGGNSTLTWTTENATKVTIDQGIGEVAQDGSYNTPVTSSKTFTLTAEGPGGTVTCDTPVTVGLQDFPSCSIHASPSNFPYGGGKTVLSWTTEDADTVSIDEGIGAVTKDGSKNVDVDNTKTFTLTATNSRGTVTCDAPVTVGAPLQPTCSLNATPDLLKKSSKGFIYSSASKVAGVVIKRIVGSNETTVKDTTAGQGSIIETPETSATYKGTFTGPGGTVTCEDTVTVTVPLPLTCDAFSAQPSTVSRGGNVTLTWNTSNADTVSINNGVGSVAVDGSQTRSVSSDTVFTLTAVRGNEQVTCETSVNVRSSGGGGSNPPRCEEFKASDRSIRSGESVTLSWETIRGTKVVIEPDIYSTTDDGEVKDGSVTVRPKKDTKYTLTVSKGSRKDTCTVSVDVSDFTVVTDRQPLTSISFTEIPYTGFDAGPVLTALFYMVLTLWALAVAYVVMFERGAILGFMERKTVDGPGIFIPKENHALAHSSMVVEEEHAKLREDVLPHFSHVAHEAPTNLPTHTEYAPSEAHVDELLGVGAHDAVSHTSAEGEAEEMISALEDVAHSHNVLLSSDALRLVIDHGENLEGSRMALLGLIERAKAAYPREDGWIILNRERVLALFTGEEKKDEPKEVFSEVMVYEKPKGASTLAEAIVTGNTTRAYELLGEDPLSAIADAAESLDEVVRARKGQGSAPDLLMHASEMVTDEKLKAAVIALVAAIDGTYSDQTAAVRLAVIKALKATA